MSSAEPVSAVPSQYSFGRWTEGHSLIPPYLLPDIRQYSLLWSEKNAASGHEEFNAFGAIRVT